MPKIKLSNYKSHRLSLFVPYAVLLFAFGLRVYAVDTSWIHVDQTILHGRGIALLDDLMHGRWSALPIFTYNSSSGLFNPALMEYVWALVAALDSGIAFGTLLNLIVNASGVAMLYALMRRVAGRQVALFAMLQMAISPWAIGIARGMWQPGQLELCFVLVSWLVLTGLTHARPRWVLAGFIAAAIVMWTYILTLGTVAFAGLASLVAYQHRLRRPILLGWLICTVSSALMFGLALAEGKLSNIINFNAWASGSRPAVMPIADAFLIEGRGTPLLEVLRVNSDFDFIRTWANPATTLTAIGTALSLFGTGVLLGLAGLGLLFTFNSIVRRHAQSRLWITLWVWLALPIIFFGLIKTRVPDFQMQTYYLLMTAPVGYMIPALALSEMSRRWNRRIVSIFIAASFVITVPVSIWNIGSAAQHARSQAYSGSLNFISLRMAEALGELWRQTSCEIMHRARGTNNNSWVVSLWQRPGPVRDSSIRMTEIASAWQVTPGKMNCLMLDRPHPTLDAYYTPRALSDGVVAHLYATSAQTPGHSDGNLIVNIGWEQLALGTPGSVPLGQPIVVSQIWRINTLPDEPYANWYFVPNIKLVSKDGQVLGEYWGTATEGLAWVVGDEIHSQVIIHPPAHLLKDEYSLLITLFDPNQKKNAVFFLPSDSAKPIVEIKRTVRIGF